MSPNRTPIANHGNCELGVGSWQLGVFGSWELGSWEFLFAARARPLVFARCRALPVFERIELVHGDALCALSRRGAADQAHWLARHADGRVEPALIRLNHMFRCDTAMLPRPLTWLEKRRGGGQVLHGFPVRGDRERVRPGAHGHELEVDQVGPLLDPRGEVSRIRTFHQLKAAGEFHVYPAADITDALRQHSSALP